MRTLRRALRDSAGITVAEVILALAIVTVGLVALLAAMPLSTSLIGEANLKTTAAFLAQQRLEQIKNAKWIATPVVDNLGGAGADGSAAVAQWPDEALNAIANYPQFQRQVRIKDCSVAPLCIAGVNPANLLATLRQVTVAVSFARMTGVGTFDNATLDSVQLVTLIAKR